VNGVAVSIHAQGPPGPGVTGTNGPDVIDCSDAGPMVLQIFGLGGDDRIIGSDSTDTIYAGPGDDDVRGGLELDLLYGEEGNDTLRGGALHDFLDGDLDDYYFPNQHDTGIDSCFGDAGDDAARDCEKQASISHVWPLS
jgi:Ca2+-binding RTX toxin-like protein